MESKSNKYLNKYDWIKQKYEGILEIYPRKCMNAEVLDFTLKMLTLDGYKLVKITNDWIRAFE